MDKRDSDTGLLQRKCAISKGGRDRTYVGRHSILTLRMAVTRLNKMANINGKIYLKPCDGFEKGLRTKWIEWGTYLLRSGPNLEGGGCGIVTKRYDLYFGSCGHFGIRWRSKCLDRVIMVGHPLGDAPSVGVLCSIDKARCCRSSDLGKKQVSIRHKRPKATQQDLSNRILLCKTIGIRYVRPWKL